MLSTTRWHGDWRLAPHALLHRRAKTCCIGRRYSAFVAVNPPYTPAGGQWKRAEAAFAALRTGGHSPSPPTVAALLQGLAAASQGDRALELLEELSAAAAGPSGSGGADQPGALPAAGLAAAHNVVIRAIARQGQVMRAYERLGTLAVKGEVELEASTVRAGAVRPVPARHRRRRWRARLRDS